jgi:hypothetical protein
MDGAAEKRGKAMIEAIRNYRQFGSRRAVLAPYVEKLVRLGPEGIGSVTTTIGDGLPRLELWERNGLQMALNGGSGPPTGSSSLLVEGIALRSKVREELDRFESGELREDETLERLICELITNAAIGLTLITEAQKVITEAIVEGDMRLAKQLTMFRAKIRDGVNRIADHLGGDAFRLARAKAEAMAAACG